MALLTWMTPVVELRRCERCFSFRSDLVTVRDRVWSWLAALSPEISFWVLSLLFSLFSSAWIRTEILAVGIAVVCSGFIDISMVQMKLFLFNSDWI